MSLEKAIKHKKEYRKPYRGSAQFDRSCRNHGNCGYCVSNRTYSSNKKVYSSKDQLREWQRNTYDLYEGVLDWDLERDIFGDES